MQAIILAGGLGTRLRSVFSDAPKPMAPINGKPFLSILLRYLKSLGVVEVILSVGYKANIVSDYYLNEFEGMTIRYSHETESLGTGGAIRNALNECTENPVLVVNGDTYVEFNLEEASRVWSISGNPVIFARSVDDVSRFGAIGVKDECITSFGEKVSRGSGLINAGVYLIPNNLFEGQRLPTKFSFEEYLGVDVRERRYSVIEVSGEFIDIGTPEDFLRAQEIFS
jgi:D-glycero-alpha-D-manno-heptose 1-phosphate guanylyltransferase